MCYVIMHVKAICRQSRASCPVSRLLSVPIWPAYAAHGRQYDPNKTVTSILCVFRVLPTPPISGLPACVSQNVFESALVLIQGL